MCGINCGGGGNRLGSIITSFSGKLVEHEVTNSDGSVTKYTLDRRSDEQKKEDQLKEDAEE